MNIVTDRKFYAKAAGIALPIAAVSLITIGGNIMDTIIVGDLGEVALSDTSLANQFFNIFSSSYSNFFNHTAIFTN